ncbi:MAG: MBL fold metallo-hydrolase [Tannerella sp.]|jgi:glyoxylase-like metal-dependent hydrolase (beta-lactamase superfamily II)|nr:MBL fold metallo-hydrolase [Tannerella sp.]
MITVRAFTFNMVAVNTFVLHDETGEAAIVDCGCMTPAEEKQLSDYVSGHQLTVKRLLCTHLHFDHVLGNRFAAQTWGLQPEAHRNDVEQLPSPEAQVRAMHLPFPVRFAETGYRFLTDGETIAFGHSELTTLHTPGHSPGSLSFYAPQDGFVIAGDVLFQGGIGRTDLWGGHFDTLMASIRERLLLLPEDTAVFPGHGPPTTLLAEKQHNPFLKK